MRQVLLALAALCSFSSAADNYWHTSKVRSIYPHSDGAFVITFKDNSPNCPTPTNEKYHFVRATKNGVTQDGVELMLATALAAATQGKSVTIKFSDEINKCYVNRMRLNN